MKPTVKNIEAVCALIKQHEFGYYSLMDEWSQQKYGSFPPNSDDANASKKASPADLCKALAAAVDQLGAGKYCVYLRANSKDNKGNEVNYKFNHLIDETEVKNNANQTQQNFAGIGYAEQQQLIASEVARAREDEKRLFDREKQLIEFQHRLDKLELQAQHNSAIAGLKEKNKPDGEMKIHPAIGVLTALGVGFAVKNWPEIEPAIMGTIKALNNDNDDDDDETQVTKVQRTD